MKAIVSPGVLHINVEGQVREAALMSGFIEVLPDQVIIMAEVVEWPEEIDIKRAEEARIRAERRLKSQSGEVDVARAELALKRALVRLEMRK